VQQESESSNSEEEEMQQKAVSNPLMDVAKVKI
jgi:hypothetical protein